MSAKCGRHQGFGEGRPEGQLEVVPDVVPRCRWGEGPSGAWGPRKVKPPGDTCCAHHPDVFRRVT